MRRTPFLALAVSAITAVAAVGCGGSDEDGGGKSAASEKKHSITVWSLEKEPDRVKATEAILAAFTTKTGIDAKLVPVDEDQFPTLVTSSAAAGKLPDVMSMPLGAAQAYAAQDITDADAAQAVVEKLGEETFAPGALGLIKADGKATAVPSDGWGQLLIYRKDLFDKAGLDAPDTLDKVKAAADELNGDGLAGITLATAPADAFTSQSFEYFALANGCQLVDDAGEVTIDSPECVDTLERYAHLAREDSVQGNQDVDSTRGTYFAGRAAMIVWSPFLLDAMAGLRDDALPSCPECKSDPAFLAKNSGIVTSLSGSAGTPSQFGELTTWGITRDADTEAAKAFAEYMLTDGYEPWLAISPQGKFPVRGGTADDPGRFVKAWKGLESGVDRRAPLSEYYSNESIVSLAEGVGNFQRWGFEQGQGALVGSLSGQEPISKAVADVVGGADPAEAAKKAQESVEQIQASLG